MVGRFRVLLTLGTMILRDRIESGDDENDQINKEGQDTGIAIENDLSNFPATSPGRSPRMANLKITVPSGGQDSVAYKDVLKVSIAVSAQSNG
jgi:hypothetical protein